MRLAGVSAPTDHTQAAAVAPTRGEFPLVGVSVQAIPDRLATTKYKPDDIPAGDSARITSLQATLAHPREESTRFDVMWRSALQALAHSFGQQLIAQLADRLKLQCADVGASSSSLSELMQHCSDTAIPLSTRLSKLEDYLTRARVPYAVSGLALVRILKDLLRGDLQHGGLDEWLKVAAQMEAILQRDGDAVLGKQTVQTWRSYMRSLLEWTQWTQRLSRVSTENPTAFLKDLLGQDILPDWLQDVLEAADKWIDQWSDCHALAQSKYAALAPHIEAHLRDWSRSDAVGRLSILVNLLLDDEVTPWVRESTPEVVRTALDLLTLLREQANAIGQETGMIRCVLRSTELLTSEAFVQQVGSRVGNLPAGEQLVAMLGRVRDTLLGGELQETTLRTLLRLTDPTVSWAQVIRHCAQDFAALPQVREAASAALAPTYVHAAMALSKMLDETFWERYATASWEALLGEVVDAVQRDLAKGSASRLGETMRAISGIDGIQLANQLVELRQTQTWNELLSRTLALTAQAANLTGLPSMIRAALGWVGWLAHQVARLRVMYRLWQTVRFNENAGLDQIQGQLAEALRTWPDDLLFQSLQRGLDWLHQMPQAMLGEWSAVLTEPATKRLPMSTWNLLHALSSWLQEKQAQCAEAAMDWLASQMMLLGPNPMQLLEEHKAVTAQKTASDETSYWRNVTLGSGLSALILLALASGVRFGKPRRNTRTTESNTENAIPLMEPSTGRTASAEDSESQPLRADIAQAIETTSTAAASGRNAAGSVNEKLWSTAEIALWSMGGIMLVPAIYGCYRWLNARQSEAYFGQAFEAEELRRYAQTGDLDILNEWLHQQFPEIPNHVWLAGGENVESSMPTEPLLVLPTPTPQMISPFGEVGFSGRDLSGEALDPANENSPTTEGMKKPDQTSAEGKYLTQHMHDTPVLSNANTTSHSRLERAVKDLTTATIAPSITTDATTPTATIDIDRYDTDAALQGLATCAMEMGELWFEPEHPILKALERGQLTIYPGRLEQLIPSLPTPISHITAEEDDGVPLGRSLPVAGWIVETTKANRVHAVLCRLNDLDHVKAYVNKNVISATQVFAVPDFWVWIDLFMTIRKADDFLAAPTSDYEALDIDKQMYDDFHSLYVRLREQNWVYTSLRERLTRELYLWARELQAETRSDWIAYIESMGKTCATQLLLLNRSQIRQKLAWHRLMGAAQKLDLDDFRNRLHPWAPPASKAEQILEDEQIIATTRVLALKTALKSNPQQNSHRGSTDDQLLNDAIGIENAKNNQLRNDLLYWQSIYYKWSSHFIISDAIKSLPSNEDDLRIALVQIIIKKYPLGGLECLREFHEKISIAGKRISSIKLDTNLLKRRSEFISNEEINRRIDKIWIVDEGNLSKTPKQVYKIYKNRAINDLKSTYDYKYYKQFDDYKNNNIKADASIIVARVLKSAGCNYFDFIRLARIEKRVSLYTMTIHSLYPIDPRSIPATFSDTNVTISVYYFDDITLAFIKSGYGFFSEKYQNTFELTSENKIFYNLKELSIRGFIKRSMGLSDSEAMKLYAKIETINHHQKTYTYTLETQYVTNFLNTYIDNLKDIYYEQTSMEKFLEGWIPFYKVTYRSLYDPGYKISSEDLASIVVDATMIFVSLGIGFAAIGKQATDAIRSAIGAGVRGAPLRQLIHQTVRATFRSTGKAILSEAVSEIVPLADLIQMSRSLVNRAVARQGNIAKIGALKKINSDLVEMGGSTLDSVRKRITGRPPSLGRSSDAYAVDLLKNEKVIDDQHAISLTESLRSLREGDETAVSRIWTESRAVQSTSEFETIAPGHLVAFCGMEGDWRHFTVSLGDGRFVGIHNDSLNPLLGPQQRVVFAEQLGTFSKGKFYARQTDGPNDALQIRSGVVFGSNPEYLSKQANLITESRLALLGRRSADGKSGPITRVETLLGVDSEFSWKRSTLLVKLHDARLTAGNMGGVELSDTIDALALGAKLDLHTIQRIDLVSCGAGIGGPISTAQIVADKMGIPVNASIRTVNRRDLVLHPDWFSTYVPGSNQIIKRTREALHLKISDAIQTVRSWYRIARGSRTPRSAENAGTGKDLLASIAKLIDEKLTVAEFIATSGLSGLDGRELDEAVQQVRAYIHAEKDEENTEDAFVFGFFDLALAFTPIAQGLDLIDRESADDSSAHWSRLPA